MSRYGGDKFSVLLPETGSHQALEIAERLRTPIGGSPITIDDHEFLITMSIGVATSNTEITNLSQLLMIADSALYDAKHKGRNRVCFRESLKN